MSAGSDTGRWAGLLGIACGFLLYTGPGGDAATHSHYAIQLAWSDTAAITVELENETVTAQTVLIASKQPHTLHTVADPMTILFVDPLGPAGRALGRLAGTTDLSLLVAAMPSRVVPIDPWPGPAGAWIDDLVAGLDPGEDPALAVGQSEEVDAAIAYITRSLPGVPRLSDAAAVINVSPDRLRRIFRSRTGLPFRQFVLWERLRLAVLAVRRGANLTDSAAAAGFADSAHLSRVFKTAFGLTPSAVLSNLTIIGPTSR